MPAPSPEWTEFLREFGLPTMLLILFVSIFVMFSMAAWRFYKPLKASEVETRNRTLQTLASCAEGQEKSLAVATQTLSLIYQSISENFGKVFQKHEEMHRDIRGLRCGDTELEPGRRSGRFEPVKLEEKKD